MVDFIEKARKGRIAAVAALSENNRGTAAIGARRAQFRASDRPENVIFFTSRTHRNLGMTIG